MPYPTSCSPQAWASAAPLLLVRAFLGLDPDVPARHLGLAPRIPSGWVRVTIGRLRLGGDVVDIHAHPDGASVTGLGAGWTVGDQGAGRAVPHQVTGAPVPAPVTPPAS